MPITGSDPAYMESLSGVLRAGAGRSGYLTSHTARLTLGGTAWDPAVFKQTLELVQQVDQNATTINFTTKGQIAATSPSLGKEIILGLGSINHRLYGGYITALSVRKFRGRQTKLRFSLTCTDYSHALDRNRVSARLWQDKHPITILADLLYLMPANRRLTPNVLSTYSNLDTFQANHRETLRSAIERLTRRVGASWYVDPYKYLHVFTSPPSGGLSMSAITDSASHVWGLDWQTDLSQVRTRVYAVGAGTQVTESVIPGGTTIPVENTAKFSSSGGSAIAGVNEITYTGKSSSSGAGSLTGVSGLTYGVTDSDEVRVLAVRNNSGAQTTHGARYGGGDDGVAEHDIENGDWSDADAIAAADAELTLGAGEAQQLAFTTRDLGAVAGSSVSVNLTDLGINTSFLLRTVRITEFGRTLAPRREVTAGAHAVVDIVGVLRGVLGEST